MKIAARAVSSLLLLLLLPFNSSAEFADLQWQEGFEETGIGFPRSFRTITYKDEVYVYGDFSRAGDVAVRSIARFDGTNWADLAGGVSFEDGSTGFITAAATDGVDLYVAGVFSRAGDVPAAGIARWDGEQWHSLGTVVVGLVEAMAAENGEVYVGGPFNAVGALGAVGLARWDGSTWTAVGGGVAETRFPFFRVASIEVDDGVVWVGGLFNTAGGQPVSSVAKFDGTWDTLNGGVGPFFGVVNDIQLTDNGAYVVGSFPTAGGVPGTAGVAFWNGTTWLPVGFGVFAEVASIEILDGNVVIGGYFDAVGGGTVPAERVAAFDGTSWSQLGQGLDAGFVSGLAILEGDLYAAGDIVKALNGTPTGPIARWTGTTWTDVDRGLFGGTNGDVSAIAVRDDSLVLGGLFNSAGNERVKSLVSFNNGVIADIGGGVDNRINQVIQRPDGLYVAGAFFTAGDLTVGGIARWDGLTWSDFGGGVDGVVEAMAFVGGELVIGGEFSTAGGQAAQNLAAWDGASWREIGGGVTSQQVSAITALATDGTDLYVGGNLDSVGGTAASGVARWDGSAWDTLAGGVAASFAADFLVDDLAFSDGVLYVAGSFDSAGGGVSAPGFASYADGWATVAEGPPIYSLQINPFVSQVAVNGSEIVASGTFEFDGVYSGMARYTGETWLPMGTGIDRDVQAIEYGNGTFFAGGLFATAGGFAADKVAAWRSFNPLERAWLFSRYVAQLPRDVFAGRYSRIVLSAQLRVLAWLVHRNRLDAAERLAAWILKRADGCSANGAPDRWGWGRDWIADCEVQLEFQRQVPQMVPAAR